MNLRKKIAFFAALAVLLFSPACKKQTIDNPANNAGQTANENDIDGVGQDAADAAKDSPGNADAQNQINEVAGDNADDDSESVDDESSDSDASDPGWNYRLPTSFNFNDIHYNDFETCNNPDGCPCGQSRCKEQFKCIHDACILYDRDSDGIGGESETNGFYCKDPNGCICGMTARCPIDAFCLLKYVVWNGDLVGILKYCGHDDEIFQNLDFNYKYIYDEEFDDTDAAKYNHVIYYEKNSYLEIKNGKKIDAFIVCLQPGCDCSGTALEDGYYCVKQHVIFDSNNPDVGIVDPSECDSSYVYSYESHECEISDDIIEPVCFNEKGCKCGNSVIQMGDTCVNGEGRCSTLNPRKGCLCGSQKLLEDGYGCLRSQPICYPPIPRDSYFKEDNTLSCKCHGKDIHHGDICTKDDVICAPNSTTTGCLCGSKPLRDGYRCFDKKQICQRDTCKCGKSDIQKDEICGNDDKPIVFAKPETKTNENGDTLLKCGDTYLNIADQYLDDYRGIYTGDYWLKFPEALKFLCSCGTDEPIPGKDYGCMRQADTVGEAPEFHCTSYINGYNCLNLTGCKCGKSKCFPILCMDDDYHQKNWCDSEHTIECSDNKYTCGEHRLPCDMVVRGYGCFKVDSEDDSKQSSSKDGWYCHQADGCPCGKITCEQYQKCESPGKCSKEKLTDSERLNLNDVSIKMVDVVDDYCYM